MVSVSTGRGQGQVDRDGAGVPDGDDEPLVMGQQVYVSRTVEGTDGWLVRVLGCCRWDAVWWGASWRVSHVGRWGVPEALSGGMRSVP